MMPEQEVIRFVQSKIRKVRVEIDELFLKKKQLEKLSDHFYTAYLDDLWNKCNIHLNENYNSLLKKFTMLSQYQNLLLNSKIGENITEEDITSIDRRS